MCDRKLGLVLSGGGAKGAYQAGIINYLAENNIQPDMVSGTSIGALNGAVFSAQRDINKAAHTINKIWLDLAKSTPIEIDSAQMVVSAASIISSFSTVITKNPLGMVVNKVIGALNDRNKQGIVDDKPLTNILDQYAPPDALIKGLPLYISLYESDGASKDILNYLRQTMLGGTGKNSIFKHIQSISPEIIHDVIMASAALPFLFKSKNIEGENYSDGGLGGAHEAQGNTPAQPFNSQFIRRWKYL